MPISTALPTLHGCSGGKVVGICLGDLIGLGFELQTSLIRSSQLSTSVNLKFAICTKHA